MEESYYGIVQTASDALLIFEACRLGVLNKVERRLSEKERHLVRSGAAFVWDEEQTGMRRWTDGRSWTASRIHGNFLIYRELEGKRKSSTSATSIANTATSPDIGSAASSSPLESGFVKIPADVSNTVPSVAAQSASGSPSSSAALIGTFKNMANLKTDGLIKLSFSVTLVTGNRYHLVHYYTPADVLSGLLKKPSKDPALADITISREYYPDTVNNIRTGDLKFHPRRSLSPNSREKVPSKRLDMSQAPRSVFGTACHTNPEQGQEVQLENRPPLQIHASNSLDLGTPTAQVMDTNPGTWLYQQNSYETIAHLPLLSSEFSRPLSHILGTNDMNTDNFRQGSVSSHSLSASSNGSDTSSYIPLTPPAYFTTFSLQPAPYQEVAWEKFPNSEIKRQLEAVYAMLSL